MESENYNQYPVRIIVAGSRPPKQMEPQAAKGMLEEYRTLIFSHLDALLSKLDPAQVAIVSGMAAGADMIGHEYAKARGMAVIEMPADWGKHGKRAGYLRNEAMAEIATHAVVYYDGQSKGSAHMIDIAQKKQLNLRVENKMTPDLFARYTHGVGADAEAAAHDTKVDESGSPAASQEASQDIPAASDMPKASALAALPAEDQQQQAAQTPSEQPVPDQAETATEMGAKPENTNPAPVIAFVPPSQVDQELLQKALNEPERFRIQERMDDVILEVQAGVDQAAGALELPLDLADPVGDEIPVVALDTETTGFDPVKNKIIEIGMVRALVSPSTGQVTRIERACSLLEDPLEPLSADIIRVTGLTDDQLAGYTIDDSLVASFFKDNPLVIAHNSPFDRPFFENRFKELRGMNWLCSLKQAPWQQKGFESSKLEYLALKSGFFFGGHRAAVDALAVLELLKRHPDVFPYMLQEHQRVPVTFRALGAPFDVKDALKEAGFKWDDGSGSGTKAWFYETSIRSDQLEQGIAEHKAWMKTIYGPRAERCAVETDPVWKRYMSPDVKKECLAPYSAPGDAQGQVKQVGNEP
ncbi:MAG: DUF2493 domain-containing protein [Marinospirillum sp.]|uniref:3'-5' exonuclease n=1 Tax=Marinospirillum sp. TaxID=2183934 RepID=UPI0019E1BE4E|nr:3'-5' exonuclease [Marinospirillum sp.]MBE0508015.1 DUF2493 domain-containing protein [Marinospirillum sp.]